MSLYLILSDLFFALLTKEDVEEVKARERDFFMRDNFLLGLVKSELGSLTSTVLLLFRNNISLTFVPCNSA